MELKQLRYEIDRLEQMVRLLQLGVDRDNDFYIQIRTLKEEVDNVEQTISSLQLEIKHLEDQSL